MVKKQLRQEVLRERQALSRELFQAKSNQICTRLINLPMFAQAETIMLYLDFRQEPATDQVLREALALGKRVVIPVTELSEDQIWPSQLIDYPADLQTGTYGILEPKRECRRPVNPQEIDLVVVPGVAFDPAGNRLGYGRGLFDRFLPTLKAGVCLVALAFEIQIKAQVYAEPHDYPVQWIVTEDRLIKCK